MDKKPLLIIVNGFPATGKGSISRKIAEKFRLTLICVDELKEIIFDRVGNWDDVALFDKVAKSTYDLMYHVADRILSSRSSCILEAFFKAEMAEPKIKELILKYGCNFLQVHLKADGEIIAQRYRDRHDSGDRHLCHPREIAFEEFIKAGGKNKKVDISGVTLDIDTTDFNKVDLKYIYLEVKKLL